MSLACWLLGHRTPGVVALPGSLAYCDRCRTLIEVPPLTARAPASRAGRASPRLDLRALSGGRMVRSATGASERNERGAGSSTQHHRRSSP